MFLRKQIYQAYMQDYTPLQQSILDYHLKDRFPLINKYAKRSIGVAGENWEVFTGSFE